MATTPFRIVIRYLFLKITVTKDDLRRAILACFPGIDPMKVDEGLAILEAAAFLTGK